MQQWDTLYKELKEFRPNPESIRTATEALKSSDFQIVALAAKILTQHPKSLNAVVLQNCIQFCLAKPPQTVAHCKAFVWLLKLVSLLMQEFKYDAPEQFIRFVFRCCFIGIAQFHNIDMDGVHSDISSDSDSGTFQDKNARVLSKVRSAGQLLLQHLIRQQPQYFTNNWQLLLRSKNYSEQSLLSLLVHEPSKKTKINVITTLIILLDLLNISKWIQGYDFTRIQSNAFQPKALQFYQAAKSIHETNLLLLSGWKQLDYQYITMILKLELVLMNSSQIVAKLPPAQGGGPLYNLFVQWHQIGEVSALNLKIAAYQVVNQLLMDGCESVDVVYLIRSALVGIFENYNSQDNLMILLVVECFTVLQKVQRHFQQIFLESIPDVFGELGRLQQVCRDTRLLQQYYRIFEEMSAVKCSNEQLCKLMPGIIVEALRGNADVVPCGLNMLNNLTDDFWEQQDITNIEQINSQVTLLYNQINGVDSALNTSSMKICFYKCIGSLSCCSAYVRHAFVVQSLQKMFDRVQGSNIHVLEKSSWAAANLSALTRLDAQFYPLFMSYSINSKEKISTNGLRGLGYYLMRQDTEFPKEEIIQCYYKNMLHKNPKVSWNASTSLGNAVTGEHYQFLLHDKRIQQALLDTLNRRDNLKAQIHCMDIVNKIDDHQWGLDVIKAMLHIISEFDGEHNNFLEQKYQRKLREQIFESMEQYFKIIPQPLLVEHLEKDLHREDILQRLLDEMKRHIVEKKPADAQVFFAQTDLTKEEVLQYAESQDEDIISKQSENTSTQPICKYMKVVTPGDEFMRVFQQMAFIGNVVHQIIEDSNLNDQVPFSTLIAFEDIGSDITLIKL